jgi:replication factor C small subunit
MLFVEKYRPKEFNDVVGLSNNFKSIDLNNIPHLLFYGSPGTGKTTLAKIIINKLKSDSLILNASDERGIDIIREKVKVFASTKSTNGKLKVIFLDEGDYLTMEAQTSLRNIFETYHTNCRFIITCNYINKIIEPLKSRCVVIEFNNINKDDIKNRLINICRFENIIYQDEVLNILIEKYGLDMRKMINKIEELKAVGLTIENLKLETKLAEEIFLLLKQKKFKDSRQRYLDIKPDNEQFLKDLYNVVMNSSESINLKKTTIFEIAECYKWLGQVAWKEILIEDMFLKIMGKY